MTSNDYSDGQINAAGEELLELDLSSDLDDFLFRLASESFSDWNAPEADEAFRNLMNVTS